MLIREAKSDDIKPLTLLMKEGFGWRTSNIKSDVFFSSDNIKCLIAENKNGDLMGSASLHLIQKIDRKIGLIEDVVVFKKFQGKKIGFKIIKELIEISKNEKCYKIILNTNKKNISYYKKLGFNLKEFQMELRNF